MTKSTNEVPKTIEQLKKWYIYQNLPDEEITRFFIGKNYKGPKAFGIYKDKKTDNYIVYKNKSDGTRFIRYNGKDETYAVNEIFLKLKHKVVSSSTSNKDKSTMSNNVNQSNASNMTSTSKQNLTNNLQRIKRKRKTSVTSNSDNIKKINESTNSVKSNPEKSSKRFFLILSVCLAEILIFITIIFILVSQPEDGYYLCNNNYYYYQNWSWYVFKYDIDDWEKCNSAPKELKKHSSNYIVYDYNTINITHFENSRFYKNSSSKNWNNTLDVEDDFDEDI